MKFLQVIVLVAILVGCVAATYRSRGFGYKNPKRRVTKKSLTRRAMAGIPATKGQGYKEPVELTGESLHRNINIDEVLKSSNLDYMAESINNMGQVNMYTLGKLCEKPVDVIGAILKKVNFSQQDLAGVASSQELACNPDKFVFLLDKITKTEDQEATIERGIENLLAYTHRQCIPPLLIAMRGRPLESVAVKKAFKSVTEVVDSHEPGVLWCTFEHPAITHDVYADGLFASAKDYALTRTFKWLLEKADKEDLRALQAKEGYNDLRADVHASVTKAEDESSSREPRLAAIPSESIPASREFSRDVHPPVLEYERAAV